LQHQLQSQLNQLVISVNRKGLMTLAVSPMTIDCRLSIGESKMMKEAKCFVRETETFQYIKKPDGFDRVHLLLGRLTTFSKPALAVGAKLKKRRSCNAKAVRSPSIRRHWPYCQGVTPLFTPADAVACKSFRFFR